MAAAFLFSKVNWEAPLAGILMLATSKHYKGLNHHSDVQLFPTLPSFASILVLDPYASLTPPQPQRGRRHHGLLQRRAGHRLGTELGRGFLAPLGAARGGLGAAGVDVPVVGRAKKQVSRSVSEDGCVLLLFKTLK